MLSPRTERDYRQVVEPWTRDGQPDPVKWVSERSSEATRRNARAGRPGTMGVRDEATSIEASTIELPRPEPAVASGAPH